MTVEELVVADSRKRLRVLRARLRGLFSLSSWRGSVATRLRNGNTTVLVGLPICLLAGFVAVPGRFAASALKERRAHRAACRTGLDVSHRLSFVLVKQILVSSVQDSISEWHAAVARTHFPRCERSVWGMQERYLNLDLAECWRRADRRRKWTLSATIFRSVTR